MSIMKLNNCKQILIIKAKKKERKKEKLRSFFRINFGFLYFSKKKKAPVFAVILFLGLACSIIKRCINMFVR